jgi:hypothetical protein
MRSNRNQTDSTVPVKVESKYVLRFELHPFGEGNTMFSKKLLTQSATAAALSLAILAAPFASAVDRPTNPLHPTYFLNAASDVKWVAANLAPATPYLDTHNPLLPSFSVQGNVAWLPTSLSLATAYFDTRNPLSPSYKF